MTVNIERVKHKIKGLLARNVQNGATIAEAEVCLEKAYQLLSQFDLDIEDLLKDTDPNTQKVIREDVYESGNIAPELWELYCQVAWLFNCEAIKSMKRVAGYKYRKTFIDIIGNPINVEKVKYFMNLFIDMVQQLIKSEQITGLRNINSFKRGFYLSTACKAQKIRFEREKQEEQEQQTGTSLMVLDRQNVEDFIQTCFGDTLQRKTNNFNNYGKSTNYSHYLNGQKYGNAVNFQDPLGSTGTKALCKH